MLTAENVIYTYKTRYQTVYAVNDVSAEFEAGKFYAIVGASGSGKTTLLSLLAGLDVPAEGTIAWEGPSTAKPDLSHTYFVQDKKNTDPFFRATRVGSCNKVVIRNGIPFAICYKIRNQKGQTMNNFKNDPGWKPEERTIYQKDYKPKPEYSKSSRAII